MHNSLDNTEQVKAKSRFSDGPLVRRPISPTEVRVRVGVWVRVTVRVRVSVRVRG